MLSSYSCLSTSAMLRNSHYKPYHRRSHAIAFSKLKPNGHIFCHRRTAGASSHTITIDTLEHFDHRLWPSTPSYIMLTCCHLQQTQAPRPLSIVIDTPKRHARRLRCSARRSTRAVACSPQHYRAPSSQIIKVRSNHRLVVAATMCDKYHTQAL